MALAEVKSVLKNLNNQLKEAKVISKSLAKSNNSMVKMAGNVAGAVGYGRRKKRSSKKKGGASASKKKLAVVRKALRGGNFGNFLKSAISLPLMATGGLAGGLLQGVNNF